MKHVNTSHRESEKGFTLVELAVVMIIIGVLLGGVLKGQEMITNARVTSTAKDMESFSAAANTFFDQYNVKPGMMTNANARLSGCGNFVACANNAAAVFPTLGAAAAAGSPNSLFFGQLLATGLIGGMDGSAAPAVGPNDFGISHPVASIGGGFVAGDSSGGAPANTTGFNTQPLAPNTTYLGLTITTAAAAAGDGAVTAVQAGQIDTRLDDGNPQTGYVIGQNIAGECVGTAGDNTYTGAQNACVIFYRL